ncbi:unnamed protein product [Caenorhabditis auriculariae]|uniref:Uncharacterized protein n=1 Tax=Caenorhabditis auriculariae TaxID=2777116 RepID=A0A8S1HHR1_9PELO|nr:unnamed protein product [Caenorhabditis auriculariae]
MNAPLSSIFPVFPAFPFLAQKHRSTPSELSPPPFVLEDVARFCATPSYGRRRISASVLLQTERVVALVRLRELCELLRDN